MTLLQRGLVDDEAAFRSMWSSPGRQSRWRGRCSPVAGGHPRGGRRRTGPASRAAGRAWTGDSGRSRYPALEARPPARVGGADQSGLVVHQEDRPAVGAPQRRPCPTPVRRLDADDGLAAADAVNPVDDGQSPGPQSITSRWESRLTMRSSPAPEWTRSRPGPGMMRSLPGPPNVWSLPPPPNRTSLPTCPKGGRCPRLPAPDRCRRRRTPSHRRRERGLGRSRSRRRSRRLRACRRAGPRERDPQSSPPDPHKRPCLRA
jgi:hypothetical protein